MKRRRAPYLNEKKGSLPLLKHIPFLLKAHIETRREFEEPTQNHTKPLISERARRASIPRLPALFVKLRRQALYPS
jgi:hypothetical protein